MEMKRFLQLLHPQDRDPVSQAVEKAISGDGNYEGEHRVLLPNGEVRWISSAGRVEFDEAHKPVRMRGISLDVTRLKQAELQIQHQREELTHLSRVAMLGEFSGSIAHELNQPLTAILSNTQAARRFLAQDPPDLSELREILDDIVADDQRAGEIIKRLRQLYEKGVTEFQTLDLNKLVRDVLKLVRSDLLNRRVDLHTELARNLPPVSGDPIQLQQVLINLITNACNSMAGLCLGNRRLTVRTAVDPSDGVRATIADCGEGIPPDKLARVFEAFYSTTPRGMGLGLALCQTIINAHSGRLWAENNPEEGGASFHFVLPVNHSPPAHQS
jgi:signal transduction histidine kinase